MKLAQIALAGMLAGTAFAQGVNDYSPQHPDLESGAARIAHIRERLASSSCPWTADEAIAGWWGGEQPGVEIRKYEKDYSGAINFGGSGSFQQNFVWKGHAIANFHQGPYGAGGNALNDAHFAAHACDDIKYLLDHLEK